MTNTDKQFRELHQFLNDLCDKKVVKICGTIPLAEALCNAGYRKVDENHIVIPLDGSKMVIPRKDQQMLLQAMYEQTRKETAKEIFSKLREKSTKSFLDWEGNICYLSEEYVSMRDIEAVLGVEVEDV